MIHSAGTVPSTNHSRYVFCCIRSIIVHHGIVGVEIAISGSSALGCHLARNLLVAGRNLKGVIFHGAFLRVWRVDIFSGEYIAE